MRASLAVLVLALPLAAWGTPMPKPRPAHFFSQDKELLIRQIRDSMRGLQETAPDEAGSMIIGAYTDADAALDESALKAARREFDAWKLRFRAFISSAAGSAPSAANADEDAALKRAVRNQETAAARFGVMISVRLPGQKDFPSANGGAPAARPSAPPLPPSVSGDERLRARLIAIGADPSVLSGISEAAKKEGVDPLVLLAMTRRETNLKKQTKCLLSNAVEPAVGRLQIKLTTARDYGDYNAHDLCDLATNVTIAAEHLKTLTKENLARVDRFDDGVRRAIASYYAGAGTISKGLKGHLHGYWERYNWNHAWTNYVPTIEDFFNQMHGWEKPGS